jgi:hypothetical protein
VGSTWQWDDARCNSPMLKLKACSDTLEIGELAGIFGDQAPEPMRV